MAIFNDNSGITFRSSSTEKLAYVQTDPIDYVLSFLNAFHKEIKFNYEIEDSGEIAFLDALLVNGQWYLATTHKKSRHNDMY